MFIFKKLCNGFKSTKPEIVFGLETGIYVSDAPEDAGKDITLWAPQIGVYRSAKFAEKKRYGLEIIEGDLKFFAADGSPMEPVFSKEPRIYPEKNTFFPGVYTLRTCAGDDLQTAISKRIENNASPNSQLIIFTPASDIAAKYWGWKNAKAMQEAISESLKIFSDSLRERVVYQERK